MSTLPHPQRLRRGLQPLGWSAEARLQAFEQRLALGQELRERKPDARRSSFVEKPRASNRLVNSATGRIEHILLCVPPNRNFDTGEAYAEVVNPRDALHFRTLIWALGAKRRYTVVCGLEQEPTVREWFAENSVPEQNVELVFSRFNYTIWAQDAYVALTDLNGGASLCEGVRFLRNDDMVIADDVAAQTSIRRLQSILEFQGGNILGSPTGHLIGVDYINGNLGHVGPEEEAAVVAAFEELLGGPVRPVGLDHELPDSEKRGGLEGSRQPIFHIDMYMTLTGVERDGREVALVASPRMARDVLGEPTRPSDQNLYFDQAADQLGQWYDVERMPLLPLWGNVYGWDDSYDSLTWNNAVLETYPDSNGGDEHRLVYLPQYQEDEEVSKKMGVDPGPRRALDQEARRIWADDLGFEVIPSDGLEDLAYGRGAIHCITKVLERSMPRVPSSKHS